VGIGIFFATTRTSFDGYEIVSVAGLWSAGWIVGTSLRIRRRHTAAVESRAEVLEQDSEARAREAVADERSRITRELHDIIGHTLNLIVVQAGAARTVFKSRPDQALESLSSIETTARQSLSDMERMLGILGPSQSDEIPFSPQPGLGQVDRLAEQFTDAGLPVEVNVAGEPHNLPTSLDLSAYRIVQEALTNALKHAGPAKARVAISYLADKLELDIVDDGQGSDDDGNKAVGGRGLIGMRERVSLFGGELDVAPASEGGFRVHASLPFEESR
jgi:signal transduction histidine kinase